MDLDMEVTGSISPTIVSFEQPQSSNGSNLFFNFPETADLSIGSSHPITMDESILSSIAAYSNDPSSGSTAPAFDLASASASSPWQTTQYSTDQKGEAIMDLEFVKEEGDFGLGAWDHNMEDISGVSKWDTFIDQGVLDFSDISIAQSQG
jgi:hypothetical protein